MTGKAILKTSKWGVGVDIASVQRRSIINGKIQLRYSLQTFERRTMAKPGAFTTTPQALLYINRVERFYKVE
jgi:hypothetical protein